MKYVTIENDTLMIAVKKHYKFSITKEVDSEIRTAYQNGCTKAVVDFQDTWTLDSSALRQLVGVRNHVHPENFSARNARGPVLQVLRSNNFDSWLSA